MTSPEGLWLNDKSAAETKEGEPGAIKVFYKAGACIHDLGDGDDSPYYSFIHHDHCAGNECIEDRVRELLDKWIYETIDGKQALLDILVSEDFLIKLAIDD